MRTMLKLSIIIEENEMVQEKLKPIHPGEVLLEEFLKPLSISQKKLALDIHVSGHLINEIVNKKRAISAEIALRLGRYFKISPQFWMGLQMDYELDTTADALFTKIEAEVPIYAMVTQSNQYRSKYRQEKIRQ